MPDSLPSTADKPRFVAAMFSRIAPRYDLMNTLMTAGQDARWRRVVVDALLAQPSPVRDPLVSGQSSGDSRQGPGGTRQSERPPAAPYATLTTVLDVGTGTGKLAAAILQRRAAARVVGIDFAEPMVRAARRVRPGAGPGLPSVGGQLQLAVADALRLPFAAASFDAVVSAFVVRNLADVAKGLAEQARVLRPGGRLIILEITPGPPGLPRRLFRLAFRGLVPRLGRLVAGDPAAYTYLPDSAAAFVEPERLVDELRGLGFEGVWLRRLALGSVALSGGTKPTA